MPRAQVVVRDSFMLMVFKITTRAVRLNPVGNITTILTKYCTLLLTLYLIMPTEVQEETFTLEEVLAGIKEMHRLILWNDDHNTFDHVIHCMIRYLDYSDPQAQKIAWKVHNEGKCAILEGSFTEVEVYRKILQQEGLTVSVE
jgi:ATP-dependent Clp protease adaptor protein ClpS